MAYNSMFPMGYQYYTQYQAPQMQAQAQQGSGIIWVQGEAGAKSYLVAPNTTVQLWDSEAQVIYLKSADASGMPSMKILDYTIRDLPAPTPQSVQVAYATKDDLTSLQNEIDKLKKEFEYGKSTVSDDVNSTNTQ